jgi:outer membrane receptor protein involved in Fe transport
MRFYSIVTLLSLFSVLGFGQSAAGVAGISGSVKDSAGAFVPGAKVVITNEAQGISRNLTTNDAGLFTAPALIPGSGYKVTVTAQGFSSYEAKELVLQVGQNVDLQISLSLGQTTTSIEVAAAAQLIEDTKSDVSNVIGTRDIMNLPTNGRRVDAFVLNTPGVTNDGTFGLLTFRGVEGNNNFLLDGNDNTQQFYNENAGRTRIVSQISADAVQEFQVVSSNFSAEYGRAMGGIVNTVTKSGTNDIHGSAFYFLRSTGFDARDPFSTISLPNGQLVGLNSSEHFVQVGGTVGGAIIKNKLFYFLSTDITRRNFPFVDSQIKVGVLDPNNQVWVGCTATAAQCAAINALLPRFYGLIPRTAKNDLYFGRLDYNLSDKNTFNASFNYLRWVSPNGIQTGLSSTTGAGITGNGDDFVALRNGKAAWTFVPNGRFVNAFRYGLYTDREADTFDSAELGGGLGYLDVSVGGVQLGPATYLPRIQPLEIRNEFADDASWSKGKHVVKFGIDFARTTDLVNTVSNRYGSYTYLTPTAFAQDYSGATSVKNWSSYSQGFGTPTVNYAIKEIGVYLEDQWRVTDRLTLNLGLRYEKSLAPTPTVINPDWPQTSHIDTGSLNLAPRFGAAYRLNNKTVIRGGFGTYFARLVSGMVEDVLIGQGLFQSSITLNSTNSAQFAAGPNLPNALSAVPTGANVSALSLQFTQPGLKTPYSEQASLAVERQVGKDMVLTVSGMWSHGVNLYGTTDLNAPAPTGNFTYKVDDASGNQVSSFSTPIYLNPRPNTKYGGVYETTNGVSSWYDGLSVSFEKRFSHGFQSLASYTWSHAIDDGQGTSTNAVFTGSTSIWTYNGLYGYDKGSSQIDQRHRFTYSFVWTPTFWHNDGLFAKYVVNNWALSSITTLGSGRPTSETIRLTDTPVAGMLSSNSINGFGGNFRVPFLPVDSLYTPPVYREDLRLTKTIPLPKERVRLSLSFEAFNLTNTWSPTSLTTQAYTEAKGVLTYTPTAFGQGSGDGGFPDGTQARRLQASLRITF